jgi:hypothetical protein
LTLLCTRERARQLQELVVSTDDRDRTGLASHRARSIADGSRSRAGAI